MNGVPKCHRGRKLHGAVRMLWKSCTPCTSAEMVLFLTIPCQYVQQSMAKYYWYSCSITWGGHFAVNNQNCLSVVSFAPWQCNTVSPCAKSGAGAGRWWHIRPTLQISPHVITGYLHVWKNIFGINDMNRNTISTLSPTIYIVWARMNTKLQLIVYHIKGKIICGQCWWWHWLQETRANI